MNERKERRSRERKIQKLIRDHPYLLDAELMSLKGRAERTVRSGRLDVDFETKEGWVIVECKISALANKDLRQLCRYLQDVSDSGKHIHKAFLVGGKPRVELDSALLQRWPNITVIDLLYSIPNLLSFCEQRHYFDATLETCPYDGARPIPGRDLELNY